MKRDGGRVVDRGSVMLGGLTRWLGLEGAARERALRVQLAQLLTGERQAPPEGSAERAELVAAGDRHGVVGLLAHLGGDFERLARAHQARAIRALRFTLRTSRVLDEAGIVHVVMKGAVAGSRWTEPTARQQSDVDLLVRREDLQRASEAMVTAGLASHQFLAGEIKHNAGLQPKEAGGLLIEIHHALTSDHAVELKVEDLLRRRVRVETAQGPLWGLTPEDDAVYLAMHASTHALQRLAWLVDLARLDSVGVDWITAAARAREGNIGMPVELAWRETRELLATPIPEAAFHELRVGLGQKARYRALYRLAHATKGTPQRALEIGFRLALVPLPDLPGVFVHKFRAKREVEQAIEADVELRGSRG